jgi:hypothetical protein
MTANVNDLTFGIEIETTLPAGTIARVGGYHNGIQVPELPLGWTAEHDGSIHTRDRSARQCVEIVSPVLRGPEGLKQVLEVIAWLKTKGASVNQSTGLHVHVGWDGDAEALRRLVFLVSHHEKALYASTGTRSREEGSYCRTVRDAADYRRHFGAPGADGRPREMVSGYHGHGRYHPLNITNLATGRGTVEFRVFSGSVNAAKVVAYVRLALALVEKALAMKKLTKWVGKAVKETSPVYRKGGEGQTELTKLFYRIGWTKGEIAHTFGLLDCEGAPSIKDSKAELMRLARKYDGPAEGESA